MRRAASKRATWARQFSTAPSIAPIGPRTRDPSSAGQRSLPAMCLTLTLRCTETLADTIGITRSATIVRANHEEASMRISTPFVLSVLLIALPAQAQKNSQNPSPKAQPPQQQSAPASGSDSTSAYQSKIDPAKEADIHRLLELAGTKAIMSQMMEGMGTNIKPMVTNSLPPGDYRAK